MLPKNPTNGSMMKWKRESEDTKVNDNKNTTIQNVWNAAKVV